MEQKRRIVRAIRPRLQRDEVILVSRVFRVHVLVRQHHRDIRLFRFVVNESERFSGERLQRTLMAHQHVRDVHLLEQVRNRCGGVASGDGEYGVPGAHDADDGREEGYCVCDESSILHEQFFS